MMTRTEICRVMATPCRRRGSSLITEITSPPPSHCPPNPPLEKTEQSGDSVGGNQVEHPCGRPCLNVLEGIGDHFPGHEGQFRYGDGHGQRRVLEEGDERVAE